MNNTGKLIALRSGVSILLMAAGLTAAGPQDSARASARSRAPAHSSVTTTTVMGGGSPSTWPAAKPYPPSLAGAYSPNMKIAFITLVGYSDWVGSHPNPRLVSNYAAPFSNIYNGQVYLMEQLQRHHLHLPPNPTSVDFLAVVKNPVMRRTRQGKTLSIGGHPAYTDGIIDVVITQVTQPYLNQADRVVGYSAKGTGPKPWVITLGQTQRSAQFVIVSYYGVMLHESLRDWEREVVNQS
jgi:hypothetical protein